MEYKNIGGGFIIFFTNKIKGVVDFRDFCQAVFPKTPRVFLHISLYEIRKCVFEELSDAQKKDIGEKKIPSRMIPVIK